MGNRDRQSERVRERETAVHATRGQLQLVEQAAELRKMWMRVVTKLSKEKQNSSTLVCENLGFMIRVNQPT